jgi:hypothetical protein
MGSAVRFGEGGYFTVPVILCIAHQTPLYRAFSIGDTISSHFHTDFACEGKELGSGRTSPWMSLCPLAMNAQVSMTQFVSKNTIIRVKVPETLYACFE